MRTRLLTAGLLLCSAVYAADWQHVSYLDTEGGTLVIDKSSISQKGGLKKAWFRWTYSKGERMPNWVNKTDPNAYFFRESLSLSLFNCAERTSATVQGIYRNEKDEVIGSFTLEPHQATWSEVAPETIGETMLETVCKASTASPNKS